MRYASLLVGVVSVAVLASCNTSPAPSATPLAAVTPAAPAQMNSSADAKPVALAPVPPSAAAPASALSALPTAIPSSLAAMDPYGDVAPLAAGVAKPTAPPPPLAEAPSPKGCPTHLHRGVGYDGAQAVYGRVTRGWSRSKVLKEIGGPTQCAGAEWVYTAGPYSGPRATYVFGFQNHVVVSVRSSSVGCNYY